MDCRDLGCLSVTLDRRPGSARQIERLIMKQPAIARASLLFPVIRVEVLAVARDPALAAVVAMALLPLFGVGLYSKEIDAFMSHNYAVTGFTAVVSGFLAALPGLLLGWICAMRHLEDRDANLVKPIEMTTAGLQALCLIRILITSVFALAVGFATALQLSASIFTALAVGICGACQASIVACLLPVFADNKVEGIALSKLLTPFALVALATHLPLTWRFVAAPIPTFHVGELMSDPSTPWSVVLAVTVNVLWSAVALVMARKRALIL